MRPARLRAALERAETPALPAGRGVPTLAAAAAQRSLAQRFGAVPQHLQAHGHGRPVAAMQQRTAVPNPIVTTAAPRLRDLATRLLAAGLRAGLRSASGALLGPLALLAPLALLTPRTALRRPHPFGLLPRRPAQLVGGLAQLVQPFAQLLQLLSHLRDPRFAARRGRTLRALAALGHSRRTEHTHHQDRQQSHLVAPWMPW